MRYSNSIIGRKGFTLVELLVALGVGMYIVSLAFTALTFINKALKRADTLAAKTDAAQQMLLWSLSGRYPTTTAIPAMSTRTAGILVNSNHTNLPIAYVLTQATTISAVSSKSITVKSPMEIYTNQPLVAFDPSSPTSPIPDTVNSISSATQFDVNAGGQTANGTIGTYDILYSPKMTN